MLLPFFLLISTILLGILIFFLYRRLKRGVKSSLEKGAEMRKRQQEKWQKKDWLKKQPNIVQKGFADLTEIETLSSKLSSEWLIEIEPLIKEAQEIFESIGDDSEFEAKKMSSMRSFFIHTLDAFKQFTQKLVNDHGHLDVTEKKRAQENIALIQQDLIHHRNILHKKRKFDFDVLMDVIKVRLKQ